MKTALFALFLMTSVSTAAFAADQTDGKSESYAVREIICSQKYVAATGAASPDYQPGVDVNGKPVVPADVAAPAAPVSPDYVEVPMTIDLARVMNLLPAGAEMKLPVANLKLYKDGKVEYNGQDITSRTTDMCGNHGRGQEKPQPAPVTAEDNKHVQTRVAPAETVSPRPVPQYPTPAQPEDMTPQPGSVAQSSTGPVPKVEIKLPKSSVNVTR